MAKILIDGFAKLTPQQCFDISLAHVRKNGKPSVALYVDGGLKGCVYSGIGCAAAPFLTESARKTIVGSWYGVAAKASSAGEPGRINVDLIQDLQTCHDNAEMAARKRGGSFMAYFEEAMETLADQCKLEYKK